MPAELDREHEEAPVLLPFRRAASVELCGPCGHELDHRGKPCQHEGVDGARCQCPAGVRSDVFLNVQLGKIVQQQAAIGNATITALNTMIEVLLEGFGLEVDSEGTLQRKSGIVVPK